MQFFSDFNLRIFLREILVRIPAVFFALGLHEYAHALAADKIGDDTPRILKRCTPNPLKHIDPVGISCFFVFGFGWSRRIPVNLLKLKNKSRDLFLISMAGPLFSMLLAIVTGLIFYGFGLHKYSYFFNTSAFSATIPIMYLSDLLGSFMITNLIIAVFNMIPVMPLDASQFWSIMTTSKHMKSIMKYQIYGILILLGLIVLGVAQIIMNPVIEAFKAMIINLSNYFG